MGDTILFFICVLKFGRIIEGLSKPKVKTPKRRKFFPGGFEMGCMFVQKKSDPVLEDK
jgi:hypothetical protein